MILLRGLLVVSLLLLGCQTTMTQPARARLPDEGVVYLYLQPIPREADGLRVAIEGVSAVGRDGREVALALALPELRGADPRRQQLLAAGPVPAEEYSGFVLRLKSATLRGSPLALPAAPRKIDFNLTIRRREGKVVALLLKLAAPVRPGAAFDPVLAAYAPERPAVGRMGFVVDSGADDVLVFDRRSLEVFDVVPTGRTPSALAVDGRAGRVYVSLAGEDAIEVIDVPAGRIIDRIRLTAGDRPGALGITPDGRTLVTANTGSNTVSVIDTGPRAEVGRVVVGSAPQAVVMDPSGRGAFVLNTRSSSVSVLDIARGAVARTIPTDPGPVQGTLNRRGDRLYVVHEMIAYVTAIDPRALTVVSRLAVRSPMDAIAADPNTDFVYLGGSREFVVGLYDPVSFGIIDFIDAGGPVTKILPDMQENTLYLVRAPTRRVVVVHRIGKRVLGELDTGDGPVAVGVMGAS